MLTEWRGRDGVMTAAQLAVAGVNALKYPLMGFSLKRAAQKQLAGLWFHRRLTPSESSAAGDGSSSDGDVADAVTRGGAVMGGGADARCAPFWAEALALLLLHASVASVALSFGAFMFLIPVWAISVLTSCFLFVHSCIMASVGTRRTRTPCPRRLGASTWRTACLAPCVTCRTRGRLGAGRRRIWVSPNCCTRFRCLI